MTPTILFILATEAAWAALLFTGDLRQGAASGLACFGLAALLYLALLPRLGRLGERETRALVVAAVVFRLTLLPAEPSLSDDVYRYLWDGRVALSGVNPFAHAPDDPALVELRDPYWSRINYPELPTIYPPVAQGLFLAAALLGALGGRLLALKLLFGVAEALLVLGLARLLAHRGKPTSLVLVWLLHPLVILEIYHSAHLEPLPVAGLVAAAVAFERRRPLALAGAFTLSILGKFFALALLPRALGRLGRRGSAALAAGIALCYLPFLSAGTNLVRSLWEYGSRWRWYDSIFALLDGLAGALSLGERATAGLIALDHRTYGTAWRDVVRAGYPLATDEMFARVATILLFAALVIGLAWRRIPFTQTALCLTLAFAWLTPSLHPWYLLWVVPWLPLHWSRGGLALTLLVPFSYASFLSGPTAAGSWAEPTGVKILTFVVAGFLTAWDLWRVRVRPSTGPTSATAAPRERRPRSGGPG